ncbi:MAG: metal-dependent hydrolase [Acidimicrobiales bacterium]
MQVGESMPTTTLHRKSTAATRSVTPRRYAFDHGSVGPDRHWLDDDLLASHLVATLSGVIPPGERFVAESVRRQRDRLDGPLQHQVKGFLGQERLHQREHDRFNRALAGLGYPTAMIDRASAVTFAVAARFPARLQLAVTAAIEHWTAVIAEHTFVDDQFADWQTSEAARAFLAWHLVEELEHRAVAFDVMQATGVGEPQRILAMHVTVLLLLPSVVGGLVLSLLGDRDTWNPFRLARSLRRFGRTPIARGSFVRDLLAWNRPGFHPDQRNIDALLEHWNAELFGPEGLVTTNNRTQCAS